MVQGRFVSYIYRYGRNDSKEQNVGFIKVQRISRGNDRCRIQINVKDMTRHDQVRCNSYLYGRNENGDLFKDLLSECMICNGIGELNLDMAWDAVVTEGVSMDSYYGIIISCEDGGTYASSWMEDGMKPGEILRRAVSSADHGANESDSVEAGGSVEDEETDSPVEDEERGSQVKTEAQPNRIQNAAVTAEQTVQAQSSLEEELTEQEQIASAAEPIEKDYCRELLDSCQKLDTIDDSRLLECVKIEPQDIGRMAMSNWQLGTNSFLSHAHFNYKHLMLGRILFGKSAERYVLGVPGVYSNKEKYLANMFGFHVFIPARTTRVLTGCFGYWIVEVKN